MKNLIKNIINFFWFWKKKPVIEQESYTIVKIADEAETAEMERQIKRARPLARRSSEPYLIPVHVHIIHKGEAYGKGSNISDAQVYSMINGMNEDFKKEIDSRGDGSGVSTPFQFMLSNKDDAGNPTTGMSRVNGAEKSATYSQYGIKSDGNKQGENEMTVKNWSMQNNQRVYNIWLVWAIDGNGGGNGVQGYSYFPTLSPAYGTVQLVNASGVRPSGWKNNVNESYNLKSYTNLNRTVTHETGHWLALFHTWHARSCVEDLPKQYMSYGAQVYKNTFAQCESDRMTLAYENSLKGLQTSDALSLLSTLDTDVSIELLTPEVICQGADISLRIKITNEGQNVAHKVKFKYTIGEYIDYYTWFAPIAAQGPDGYDYVSIAKINTDESKTITVEVVSVNDNPKDYSVSKDLLIPTNKPYKITVNTDVLMGQNSWDITDTTGKILYKSPAYPNFKPNILYEHNVCLPKGGFVFTSRDVAKGMQSPGSFVQFEDGDGNILVHLDDTDQFTEFPFPFQVGNNPGDFNNDGVVNIQDFTMFIAAFLSVKGDPNYRADMDLDGDGVINLMDFTLFSALMGIDYRQQDLMELYGRD